jgi:hypothetical protein
VPRDFGSLGGVAHSVVVYVNIRYFIYNILGGLSRKLRLTKKCSLEGSFLTAGCKTSLSLHFS